MLLLTNHFNVKTMALILACTIQDTVKIFYSLTGIDVEQVTVVVNFDLPLTQDYKPDFETYLHRIGRTGRFGKKGLAINMVDTRQSFTTLKAIEKYFGI